MSAHADVFIVDAFAHGPFSGNPAAVCLLSAPVRDAAMQALAAELNLSETAFVWPEGEGWRLRWFTPTTEVSLCGHATLAAAHVLWESGLVDTGVHIRFGTLSGLLEARPTEGGIELDFPAEPVAPLEDAEALQRIARALRISEPPVAVGRNRMDILVELTDEAAVRALGPDFPAQPPATRDYDGVEVEFTKQFADGSSFK